MKALTLWPEWAYAVAHLGKDGENRTWPLWESMIGVPFAIHAGMRSVASATGARIEELRAFGRSLDLAGVAPTVSVTPRMIEPLRGHIVAIVTCGRPVQHSPSRWAANDGQWFWPFTEVRTLAKPVACRGAQGLWEVPPEVAALIGVGA